MKKSLSSHVMPSLSKDQKEAQKRNKGIKCTDTHLSNYISFIEIDTASPMPNTTSHHHTSYEGAPSENAVENILRVDPSNKNPAKSPGPTLQSDESIQAGWRSDSALQHWLTDTGQESRAAALLQIQFAMSQP